MQYRKLEGIGPKVSRLVYGTAGAVCRSPEEAYDCLEYAFSRGFTVFDTAHSYGPSEENIGYWLSRSSHREEIVLFDKGFNPNQTYDSVCDAFSPDTIRAQLRMSLRRLGTDYVDFYVLHRDDPSCPFEVIIDVLNELREKGMLKRFGASNWTMERVIAANHYASAHGMEGFSVLSPGFSIMPLVKDPCGGSVTLSGENSHAFRDWLAETGMPVFPYSSLARGYVSGRFRTDEERPIGEVLNPLTIAEYDCPENRALLGRVETLARERGCAVSTVALAWLLKQPMELFPITSPTGEKHITEAIAALELDLSDEDMHFLAGGRD